MKKSAATLLFLAVCTSLAHAQSWDSIKAVTFPVLAPAFANDHAAPYRMPLSDYGWEDGPQISADGLDFYGLNAPMDLFASTSYLIANPGLPLCDLLGNMDFLRPNAGLYGMDLVSNPYGCDGFLNIDILYAHRNSNCLPWTMKNFVLPCLRSFQDDQTSRQLILITSKRNEFKS